MREKLAALKKKLKWADPFTYVDFFILPKLHALSKNLQLTVFVASYLILLFLVFLVLGVTPFFLIALSAFYAYLFFFEKEEFLDWGIYLLSAFIFAAAIYSLLGLALGTASPMVIVVSGSMEPLYHRGDVIIMQGISFEQFAGQEIFLNQPLSSTPFASFAKTVPENPSFSNPLTAIQFSDGQQLFINKEGSIVVYFSERIQEPIIHRIAAKIKAPDGDYLLTKGDSPNNYTIDQDCGTISYGVPEKNCITLYPVKEEQLQGRALLNVPVVGCVKLWLFDNLQGLVTKGSLPPEFSGIC